MFNEKEMCKAIVGMFELFEHDDYVEYDENALSFVKGKCTPFVCIALRNAMQTVYQYSIDSGYDEFFNYCGLELFGQRACLLISDLEREVFDCAKIRYKTELWFMEDASFAIVRCVTMFVGSNDTGYTSEYRAFKKLVEDRDDLFFTPEELIEKLNAMCVAQLEHGATVYEL